MSSTYSTLAVVLDKQPWGEKDARVVLYTKDYGRLDFVVRGAKSLASKLSAHLEPFNLAAIMVVPGRQWDYVGAAVSKKTRRQLKTDLNCLMPAGRFLAAAKKYLEVSEPDLSIFRLLDGLLSALDEATINLETATFLVAAAEIKLLGRLGLAADTERCQLCGNRFNGAAWQRPSGEFICRHCLSLFTEDLYPLSAAVLDSLSLIYRQSIKKLSLRPVADQSQLLALTIIKERLAFYR